MKLTCNEATTICDKSQYNEATFWEKLKLNLHLFLCKRCGRYAKQNSILSKCYDKQHKFENKHKRCLCAQEKEAMDNSLKEKL
jgi:hypothetical protein